jgi:rubrerythrin
MVTRLYARSSQIAAAEAVHAGSLRLRLTRFSCAGCAYGATSRIAPERCPMCGGTVWECESAAREAQAVVST